MKKNILFLLSVLIATVSITAQTVSFDIHSAKKVSDGNAKPRFIGCSDNRMFQVEDHGRRTNTYTLVAYNYDMVEQQHASLGTGDSLEAYGGYINGQHIDLLLADLSKNGMRVYRDRRSLSTLETEGDPLELCNLKGEKGDVFDFATATSPNGKLLAGIFMAQYQGQGADLRIALYNRELEEYWNMAVPSATFNRAYLTDEGDVILYTLGNKKDKSCHFTVVDGESIHHYSFTLEPDEGTKIMESAFLRYGNGKIIVANTVREENHTVMPVGTNIDRIDIVCYDIHKNTLVTRKHPFTDQETHRLCNTKEKNSPRHHWVQFGQIDQTLADQNGAYLMVSQGWNVMQGTIPTEYHTCGMMVMRVDADGKILWTRTQRYLAHVGWGWRRTIIPHWRNTADGIVLAWTDNAKNITNPGNTPYKEFKATMQKSTLNIWILHPDGRETQSYVQTDKVVIDAPLHALDTPGQYLAILRDTQKTRLSFITIE